MDFRLTEEQGLVRDTARDFVDRELIPHVRDWEEKGEVPRSFYRKMASLGFLGAPVPEKYGGAGKDLVSFILLLVATSRRSSSRPTTGSRRTTPCENSPPRVCAAGPKGERGPSPPQRGGGRARAPS